MPAYGLPVTRNGVRFKTSSRYPFLPLKKQSSNAPIWNFPRMSLSGDMLPPFSLLCPMSYDRASATCVCVNEHTVTQVLYSVLCYLDNRSAVGVMAHNTSRRWCLAAVVVPRGGRQSWSTIPFSCMSRFSLLQIDVELEEPETSENPTQSFEIHKIV